MTKITVPGEPVGKARARVTKWGTFTPEKTLSYESLVKYIYKSESGQYFEGPIKIKIIAHYQIPKSASKKKAAEMQGNIIRPTKKPDFDNIAKIISDALNGIAYKDDTQIVEATFQKWYSYHPRVEVELEPV